MPKLQDNFNATMNGPNARPDESNHKSRNWMFTFNNPTDLDLNRLRVYAAEKCNYMVIGHEVGKTGVPHVQGYLQLKQNTLGQTIKNQSKCLKMWMGLANAPKKAREYCMKDGDFEEYGEFKETAGYAGQPKGAAGNAASVKMWHDLRDDINGGFNEADVINKYPQVAFKHHSGIKNAIVVLNKIPIRRNKTCVHVWIGPPGCGKTTAANNLAGQSAYVYSSPNKIWWSGYDGTAPVIFDDFHGNYPFGDFKQLTDKYKYQVPVHGGLINFNAPLICITTNEEIHQWWSEQILGSHGLAALFRRINVIHQWNEETKQFDRIDHSNQGLPNHRPMWSEGCVCDPLFLAPTIEIDDSEEEPVQLLAKEELTPEKKRVTSTSVSVVPNPPKKQKVQPGRPVLKRSPSVGGKSLKNLIASQKHLEYESDSDEDSYSGAGIEPGSESEMSGSFEEM